jgi:hypothetical protein
VNRDPTSVSVARMRTSDTPKPFSWADVAFTFVPCRDCATPEMDVIACFNVTGFCLDCCGCPDHSPDTRSEF